MTIDDLAAAIRSVSPEEPAQRLADLLLAWKHDDTTANDLKSRIERAIGHLWFSTDAVHREVYRVWSEFRAHAIDGIGGMTMNERLLCSDCSSVLMMPRQKKRGRQSTQNCWRTLDYRTVPGSAGVGIEQSWSHSLLQPYHRSQALPYWQRLSVR